MTEKIPEEFKFFYEKVYYDTEADKEFANDYLKKWSLVLIARMREEDPEYDFLDRQVLDTTKEKVERMNAFAPEGSMPIKRPCMRCNMSFKHKTKDFDHAGFSAMKVVSGEM